MSRYNDVRCFQSMYLATSRDMLSITAMNRIWICGVTWGDYMPYVPPSHPSSLSLVDDTVYIYGGFSKEKLPGKKQEGKAHLDMYEQLSWAWRLACSFPIGALPSNYIQIVPCHLITYRLYLAI